MRWLCLAMIAACSSDPRPAPPSDTVTATDAVTVTVTDTDTDTDTDTVTGTAVAVAPEEPGRGTGTGTGTGDMVDVASVAPSVQLDMRYATTRNFTKTAFYPSARCLLRRDAAERLARVQRRLEERGRGLSLLLWDCYRPFSAQKRLWALVPDPRYVAEPVEGPDGRLRGSKHNRGMAVDLTLADREGRPLEMPTDHDDFSPRAHRGSRAASPAARRNARILEEAMVAEGFEPLPTEWWHFDAPGWKDAPLLDVPLR